MYPVTSLICIVQNACKIKIFRCNLNGRYITPGSELFKTTGIPIVLVNHRTGVSWPQRTIDLEKLVHRCDFLTRLNLYMYLYIYGGTLKMNGWWHPVKKSCSYLMFIMSQLGVKLAPCGLFVYTGLPVHVGHQTTSCQYKCYGRSVDNLYPGVSSVITWSI